MITAHVLVKNEENFLWYSVISVMEYVDRLLIWDTGSTDKTKEIIRELERVCKGKMIYQELGEVDEKKYSEVRQKMLDETSSGWVFILDGDEIWWNDSIRRVCEFIKEEGKNFESIVVPTLNLIGDIFHYQEEMAGKYKFGEKKGHYALRFMNTEIPGLHVFEKYGKEGFADKDNNPVQNRSGNKIKLIDAPYLHTTHLARSSKDNEVMQRTSKLKHELGILFPVDFYYPEAFFKNRPNFVPNAWKNMSFYFKLRAFVETPLRKLKRRLT